MESSGTGGLRTERQLIAIIALLVVVLLVGSVLILLYLDDQKEEFQVGDYLQYEITGGHTGTIWINVTAVNGTMTEYVVTLIQDGETSVLGSRYYDAEHPTLIFTFYYYLSWMQDHRVAEETLDTALGERSVDHYAFENIGTDFLQDIYAKEGGTIVYHYMAWTDARWEADLVGTNIEWV